MQWFRPGLKIDRFFESFFGLAQDGKLNGEGLPSPLQLAVSVPYFGDEIRLTSPSWTVQRVVFGALAPVGRLLGYLPEYPYPHGRRGDVPSITSGGIGASESSRGKKGEITVTVIVVGLLLCLLLWWGRRENRGG